MSSRPPLRVLLVLMGVLYAGEGYGCTCISLPLKQAFRGSDDVFVGTVVDEQGFTRRDEYYDGVRQTFVPTMAIIRVHRRFLGDGPELQEIRLDSCGALTKGATFLIFASRHDGILQNHGCTSQALDEAALTVKRLEDRAGMWKRQRRFRNWWSRIFARFG